jgi:HPt (histidine-containing phosphotransfer) domain-containing protein
VSDDGSIHSDLSDDPRMQPLVAMLVGELPDFIGRLDSAHRADDATALASTAHQLKGAAAMHGFPAITAAAAAVESSADFASRDEREHALERLRELCRRASASPRRRQ